MNIRRHQSGVSIVEYMIAIALGTLLTAGVLELFVSNKTTYRIQTELAGLQDHSRVASQVLSKSIRMAGYQGCTNSQTMTPNNIVKTPPAGLVFGPDDIITGHEAGTSTWTPALPTALVGEVLAGTDVVKVSQASEAEMQLVSNMVQPNTPIAVTSRVTIQQGDIILVTDCSQADIFKVTNVSQANVITHASNFNTSNNLSKSYQTDAHVSHFQSYTYYIKDTGRTNGKGTAIYALYRMDLNGSAEELVEGVDNMQITYGVDSNSDGTADTFSTASTVNTNNDWSKVISTRISLLLSTVEEVNPTTKSYTFNNATVTPSDHRLRRSWNGYIKLRNRGL